MSHRENDIILENFGGTNVTAPVIVKELLLTLSGDDLTKISAGIETEKNSGWIWLIYARTIYVWNFKDRVLSCHELPLPSSGLFHSARLCYVFPDQDDDWTRPPPCICVSPEGCVRYWPKINQTSIYIDYNVELSGQVCHLVTALKGKHLRTSFILSTTTCNSFLLTITPRSKKEPPVQCIPLKASQNLISGIGRRVSSLIFASGLSALNSAQEALVNISVIPKKGALDSNLLYVLNSKLQLQCWQIDRQVQTKMSWEIELRQDVLAKMALEIWSLRITDLQSHPNMNAWAVDFVVTARRRFAVLVAIHDRDLSPHVYYGVVLFNEPAEQSSSLKLDLVRLGITRPYEPRLQEAECNDLRLLCPFSYEGVYVHGANILVVSPEDSTKKLINFTLTDGDRILGSAVIGDQLLLFTSENGLQSVKVQSSTRTGLPYLTALGDQQIELHRSTTTRDELEGMAMDEDRSKRFNAAFIYYMKRSLPECEEILDDLFRTKSDDLDNLVVGLAMEIVDDYPASDPRWMHAVGDQIGDQTGGGMTTRRKSTKGKRPTEIGNGSSSLLLKYQLDDKRQTMQLYLSFLKSTKLRERLRKFRSSDGKSLSTLKGLSELGEKLEASAAFVRRMEDGSKTLEKIIRESVKEIVREWDEHTGDILTVVDVFFRKVSEFHTLLPVFVDHGLAAIEKYRRQNEDDPRIAQELFMYIVDGILAILNASSKYRVNFERQLQWEHPTEMKTWLNGSKMRKPLEGLYSRMSEFMIEYESETAGDDLSMAKLLRDLADSILAECSIAPDRRLFEDELRRKLIKALVSNNRHEQARNLAEKYRDFGLLIEISEQLDDQGQLEIYKEKFREDGFLDVLYDHYIATGKPGDILQTQNVSTESANSARTAQYLDARGRKDLHWIFHTQTQEFGKASTDALALAEQEKESLERKKTLLSLAKLAALASDDPNDSVCLKNASDGLITVEHQKRLPSVADGPPLDAERLIEVCINDPNADEWNFARAIDLLTSVCSTRLSRDDFVALRARIWAAAILVDDWTPILEKDEDLLAAVNGTVFSRTLQLLCSSYRGDAIDQLTGQLATAQELLGCDDLNEMAGNPKFQYVLRAGEERIQKWATVASKGNESGSIAGEISID